MAAFIKKFFKAKKPDTNRPASKPSPARQLDPNSPEDLLTLQKRIRENDDPTVRNAAVEQLNHIQQLIPLYPDVSSSVRGRIAQRINQLAKATPHQVEEARRHLTDPTQQALIEQLCLAGTNSVDQISAATDPEQLIRYAIEGKTAAVRLAAADHVQDEAGLQQIQRSAKGRDKGVYQLVKKKLQAVREAQEAEREKQQAVSDLIRVAEEHARTDNMRLYTAKVESLQAQWRDTKANASTEQQTQFLSALDSCLKRVKALEADALAEQASKQKQEERAGTLALLKETLGSLEQEIPERGPSLSALDALQKTQENRWLEATRDAEVSKAEQKDYQNLMLSLRNYIAAVQRFLAVAEELDSPDIADAAPARLHELANTVDWPAGFARPQALENLSRKLGETRQARKEEIADQSEQISALDSLLDRLEKSLEQNLFKESSQLHKQAQHAFNSLDRRHASARQARLTLLGRQLHDLQDWRGFATRPKQEELCGAMEYLADQHMEPEAKAERIKELQKEWRELGGSSDQSLWQRFKAASDAAYAPCQAYFEAKSELKDANLQTRKAICDQLAEFVENANWSSMDWKAVEQIHRVAREEWRQAWPVDFKANRGLQKRFDGLLKQVEAPLEEARQKNEALKLDIVKRAEDLLTHEPLSDAMTQAKSLQKEWEQIGITHHREDRKMWQAFRAACDGIFARRDARREEQAEEDTAAIEELKAALETSVTMRNEGNASPEACADMLKTLKQVTLPRRLPDNLKQALHDERQALQSQVDAASRQQQVNKWLEQFSSHDADQNVKQSDLPSPLPSPRDIAVRLEILTGASSPEEDQALRMQQQVARLAAGMASSSTATSTEQEIDTLARCWQVQDVTQDEAESLRSRMADALNQWRDS
ncbi:DUF349 domain-containing protein [Marinobacter sp. BGYM27]|uniref:DUF349 domain-containing protein n=1 Tax=Marinobacter sp. BGYM27 TaxID=2975597 RepID=UPI0021A3682B|nr:DUF349 domain-containing protein [Marinobacter sp. BGYM27]MDG5498649.1 DUF349 domain-containing protein [Marinobacter sp. BGYM27]